MGLKILTNNIGENATAIASSMAIKTECDVNDIVGGHRSRVVDTSIKAAQLNIDFTLPVTNNLSHLVLSNVDWFFDSRDPSAIEILYGATFTTSSLSTSVGSLTLMGVKSQDTVIAHARSSDKFRVAYKNVSLSSYFRVGKIYLCSELDIGDPVTQAEVSMLPLGDDNRFPAIRGQELYKCDASINLMWEKLTYAQVQSFYALPLYQPMFIYDSIGDLFPHKLEHVIVESFAESREHLCDFNLEVKFKRLKQYEL